MESNKRYHRKIIRIRAEDSPNVRLALAQIAKGQEPTGEELVPGVLSWNEYQLRRRTWNKIQQCVSLDAQFYKGGEVFLFPEEVIAKSLRIAEQLRGRYRRALAMGVDAAEGRDDTVWTVTDMAGIMFQLAVKTEDTSDVPGATIAFMKKYNLNSEQVLFDRGGGGKQHADQMRRSGYDVRTVGFGEAATDHHKERKTSTIKPAAAARVNTSETRYAYRNRRAEMYWLAAELFLREEGFGVPKEFYETLRQLKVIPKKYDGEGRMVMLPKDKPVTGYVGATIRGILGRSPDHADSLVLAVYSMVRKPYKVVVGAI